MAVIKFGEQLFLALSVLGAALWESLLLEMGTSRPLLVLGATGLSLATILVVAIDGLFYLLLRGLMVNDKRVYRQ